MTLKTMIVTALTPETPTMDLDDELDRLRTMIADLQTLNRDLDKIIGQRDRYKTALKNIQRGTMDKYAADHANDALNAP